MKMRLFAAALFALALGAAPALARPGAGGHALLKPEKLDRIAAELKLEPATVDKIKNRLYAAKKEHVQLRADLDAAKLDLHRLLDQENPDRNAVLKQVDVVGQRETALKKVKIGVLLDVRAMLTPEQRQKLKQLEVDRGDRGKRGGKGKGIGRGRGPHGGPPDDGDDD